MPCPKISLPGWFASYIANVYHNAYQLEADDKRSGNTFTFNSQQVFVLGKGWRAELSGFYYSGGQVGLVQYLSRYQLNTGIQKELMAGKATLKLVINDLTRYSGYRYQSDYMGVHLFSKSNPDSRFTLLSFTYRFGQDFPSRAGRKTGSEELKGRLK